MATLLEITRQQIRHALDHADTTALQWWVLALSTAAHCRDPITDQITSPGLNQLIRSHQSPVGRGHQLIRFQDALPNLSAAALGAIAILLASNLSHSHACPPAPARNDRHPPGPRRAEHPASRTDHRVIHNFG